MFRIRWPVSLALALALLAPAPALADEASMLDSLGGGFSDGLQTLIHPDEVESPQVSPESDFASSYVPVYAPLSTGDEVVIADESTAYQTVVDAANSVPWIAGGSSTKFSLLDSVRRFLALSFSSVGGTVVMVASGIVFMWWGVRKATGMIMRAFRAGRL